MPKGYHHLAYERRCQLDALKKRGDSVSEIAAALQVHRSTVYRELHRNGKGGRYSYKQAHRQAVARRRSASTGAKKLTKRLLEWVKSMLCLYWSPEQISGWLRRTAGVRLISHESIYQYVWRDKRRGGGLYHYLRHQGKKYQKRGSGTAGRGCIPGRVGIEERPNIVAEKKRLGDWEIDTIIGKGKKGAIVSMVERRTKLTKLARVSRKTATEVGCALIRKLRDVKDYVLTLTADNGKEFARHEEVSRTLETGFYFANPYHSWERGLNEHTNGLVRQYFPKWKTLNDVTSDDLDFVEFLLNNRPRKVLGFATPIEVFINLAGQASSVALQN